MPTAPMNLKRTAITGVAGGALVVWIAAAAVSPSRSLPIDVAPRHTAVEASGAALAAEITRLHERLRPTVQPMRARDLFHYAARHRAAVDAPVPIAPVPLTLPPAPLVKLVGIAEDAGD